MTNLIVQVSSSGERHDEAAPSGAVDLHRSIGAVVRTDTHSDDGITPSSADPFGRSLLFSTRAVGGSSVTIDGAPELMPFAYVPDLDMLV